MVHFGVVSDPTSFFIYTVCVYIYIQVKEVKSVSDTAARQLESRLSVRCHTAICGHLAQSDPFA